MALGRPMVIVACWCCWSSIPACWPRVRGSKLAGNWGRKSKGRKGLAEWLKVLMWAWSQRENAWSCRFWLGCEKPALLSGAACQCMWRLLVEGLASPKSVLWCRWTATSQRGLCCWLNTVAPVIIAIEVWFSRRWLSNLLIWESCIAVLLSCWDCISICWLSWANCSSCWPTLVDSMAKECSVEPPVVMVVIAATSGGVALWTVLARGPGCCSDVPEVPGLPWENCLAKGSLVAPPPGKLECPWIHLHNLQQELGHSYCCMAVGDLCKAYHTLNTLAHVWWA